MGCIYAKNAVHPQGRPSSNTSYSPATTVRRTRNSKAQTGPVSVRQEKETKPSDERKFADHIVRQHNIYRREHGNVGDLTLNLEMCDIAQRWAQQLANANVDKLEHSSPDFRLYRGVQLGENLAHQFSSDKRFVGMETVTVWYDEILSYNFNKPEQRIDEYENFTQVVWKDTREVGVGRAFADNGQGVYVVCNYYPQGNVIGRFRENVLPKSY